MSDNNFYSNKLIRSLASLQTQNVQSQYHQSFELIWNPNRNNKWKIEKMITQSIQVIILVNRAVCQYQLDNYYNPSYCWVAVRHTGSFSIAQFACIIHNMLCFRINNNHRSTFVVHMICSLMPIVVRRQFCTHLNWISCSRCPQVWWDSAFHVPREEKSHHQPSKWKMKRRKK